MSSTILNIIDEVNSKYEILINSKDEFEKKEALEFILNHQYDDTYITNIVGTMYLDGIGVSIDSKKAFSYFRISYKKKNIKSSYYLGYCYYNGIGVKKDYNKSYYYLHKAYKEGCKEAAFLLGLTYYYGNGSMVSYNNALSCFLEAAKNGVKESYCYIGLAYYYGRGVAINYHKARHWFDKDHNKDSLYYLGLLYINGYLNGKIDGDMAYKCFSLASGLENKEAFVMVGDCYLYGYGVKSDVLRALEIYREGYDELNVTLSYAKLGYAYIYCDNVNHDVKRGLNYLFKGAKLNDSTCYYYLGKYYSDNINIRPNIPMAQEYFIKGVKLYDARCCYELALIEKELNHYDVYEGLITDAIKLGSIEAKLLIANEFIKSNKSYTRNKGFTYFKDVAKTYNNEALFNAGLCYMRGKGIKKNSKKALKYLILASENGNIDSYYYIGKLYDTNKIVKINHNKALEYYLKGSEEGNVYCSYMLGKRYVEGKILQKNTEKGLDLLEEASNEIGIATFYLAKIYDEGKYVEKNIDKAIEYLNRGSNQKDPNAKFMLGFYYYNGTGVRKDKTKALTLFKEARKLGNKDAEKMLGDIR